MKPVNRWDVLHLQFQRLADDFLSKATFSCAIEG